ncbi:hypothetical protein [Yoonia sp. 208BN28-4]|uniref:hypothetical protein n=1 Tax=Yoonia sp. 208BN28-4 TaxID=3126505 RepID=UPI00309DB4A3
MSIYTQISLIAAVSALAACSSGSGSDNSGFTPDFSFNDSAAAATAANGGNLRAAELDTQGTIDPTDDVTTSVGGYVLASDGTLDTDVSSVSAGGTTTLNIAGSTVLLPNRAQISETGGLEILQDSIEIGDASTVTIFATGDNLDADGTPDRQWAYVRGLTTPVENLADSGTVTYDGEANFAAVGSTDVEQGTFSMNINLGNSDVDGEIDLSSFDGTIDAVRDGSALAGEITINNSSDTMALYGNLYGLSAEEFAGTANGTVDGTEGVVVLHSE